MNHELIGILEHLEREKGIKKDILVQAVESALVSAVRKEIKLKKDDEQNIEVKLDTQTGKISAFLDGKEITAIDFGRIAAQTAKQVIIQKIREAEKEIVFDEFNNKVGQIVAGTVYRFERGNIIVDLLGKAEGILPKKEQILDEKLHQGERVRVYCMEVKREAKGSQIILSRTHPNLVKKLFELEVPEIYEGVVEIKGIARLPGERTKIAVYSKDEKIDCAGACIGMRGNRVRNIVTELHGEKIDIVRWNENIQQFISESLAPAKITKMVLDKEHKKATVIVDDDQLSLAIGKHGQNVRLASKLCGWELDIRAVESTQKTLEVKEEIEEKQMASLNDLTGVGKKLIKNLAEAGFADIKSIAESSVEKLTEVKGIGEKKADSIIKEAKKLLQID